MMVASAFHLYLIEYEYLLIFSYIEMNYYKIFSKETST
jgi:hypothetical protein